MATLTLCDVTRRTIPSPSSNAGRRATLITHGGVTLRVEAVAPCDLHPDAIRQIVRDGVEVDAPRETQVLELPVRGLQLLPGAS
jgi:hypothetical protein